MILFETLNQPHILFWLTICGFCSGFFFDICYLISFLCNNNKIVKNVLECIATICSFVVLFFVNLATNYGQFRIYVFVVFFVFLLLQRITLGKIIAKTQNLCYNNFKKLTNWILKVKNKWKTKENSK